MGHYRYVYGTYNWENEFRTRCQAAWNHVRRLDGPPQPGGETPLQQAYRLAVDAAVARTNSANTSCTIFSPDAREVDGYLLRNLGRTQLPEQVQRSMLADPEARRTAEAAMVRIYSENPPGSVQQHFP